MKRKTIPNRPLIEKWLSEIETGFIGIVTPHHAIDDETQDLLVRIAVHAARVMLAKHPDAAPTAARQGEKSKPELSFLLTHPKVIAVAERWHARQRAIAALKPKKNGRRRTRAAA